MDRCCVMCITSNVGALTDQIGEKRAELEDNI